MTAPEASRPVVEPLRLKCPVCAAGFRGVEICPRCGTNLEPLMRMTARAWALRRASRAKLHAGDLAAALRGSSLAWEIQHRGAPVSSLEQVAKSNARTPEIAALPPTSTPGQNLEPHHIPSSADRTGEPGAAGESLGARPAPLAPRLDRAEDTAPTGPPWQLALALMIPALLWIAYLVGTRRTPGNHGAAADCVALLTTLAAGTVLYWRGSHGRRPTVGALLLYVLSQALWLAVVGLLIATRLEMP
jgi:hypothetical protein